MTIDANFASALIAMLALGFSIFAHISASTSEKRTVKLEEKNAQLAEMQNHLAHRSWSDEFFRDITHWACQVTSAISRAIHLIGVDDEEQRRETLITLSSCIDMGRWYFPNIKEDEFGQHKEPAYRGLRQPLLDWAVYAYDVFDKQENYENAKERLVECQRQFVSAIQSIVDPRSREEEVQRILCDFGPVAALPKIKSPEKE